MKTFSIEAKNVSRSFGRRQVVRDLDLRIRRGSIYGLLGRNGAGKTTVIKMLAGLTFPDAGEIKVNGIAPEQFAAADRAKIGYVSERQILMPNLSVQSLIAFTSQFYAEWDSAVCDRILRRFKINPATRIHELSLGTTRQVAFMLALAQKPDVLLLDEPAANLDVLARREFMDELLQLMREENKTVLLSSHILSDIERVADEVGIMIDGTVCISEPLDRLKETVKQVRFHGFEHGTDGFQIPGAFRFRKTASEALATLRVEDDSALAKLAATHRCHYEINDLNLEDIFVEMVRETSSGSPGERSEL
jgi:ABC-2 type transport system ATP-binding protein